MKKILFYAYKIVFKLVSFLPTKKNVIMFESFLGKQYSCNPRAIYEYLKENHPNYDLYWSVDPRFEKTFLENNIPYLRRFSIRWLFKMARAQFWVSNSRMPLWIPKPRKTIYIQTWHGTPLKKLAHDMGEVHMPGTTTKEYKRDFYKESRNWDYLISPNNYSSEIFKRAFRFEKPILESGYPRNDIFYIENIDKKADEFKKTHNLPDKKVILYAPTWRDNQYYQVGKYKMDLQLDLMQLKKALGDEYIIILRMHYLVAESFNLDLFEGFAFDFSQHEDIRDLYLVSDVLVTDYSSVFFDYANLKRPIIFFVYDIEEYRDEVRGFYFDFEREAPGPLVRTTEEVITQLKKLSYDPHSEMMYTDFFGKFCYLEDGCSTKRVVEELILNK